MNLPVLSEKWLEKAAGRGELRVWGIDLGTTKSAVAEIVWSPGRNLSEQLECRCLELDQPTAEGISTSTLVPSVVAILNSGERWVGEGAKRLRTRPQEMSLIPEKTLFFETKNDMGLRKTYYRADEAYNHASKIAGHILEFLKLEAEKVATRSADRISVTVPASFQLNQRRDTLLAAQYAGLKLGEHDLLDEPTSALIYYLSTNPKEKRLSSGTDIRVLVFDFGGGTCDVSILRINVNAENGQFEISPLAVSRYHRLGGGDIDAAIVHEHLIPALLAENELTAQDLTWAEKKRGLEPQLLGTAEALKIALCREIDRLKNFNRYDSADKASVTSKQPSITCRLGSRDLPLSSPTLSAKELGAILEPFLDSDNLFARETDYRLTQSIFAPIQDALERAGMSSEKVDFCLLVGGSTLIPDVHGAVVRFFKNAKVCTFPDPISTQTAVARGAAWHAFYLAAMGKPLVQPVTSDAIAILTGGGEPFVLVKSGTPIPYPTDGSYARIDKLGIPKALLRELKLEIVALSTRQPLLQEIWHIKHLTNADDPITVEYRLGAGQELDCRAYLTNEPDSVLERTVQNPLCSVVNPGQVRLQIEAAEEELRRKGGGTAEDREAFVQLAKWYAELNQYEKALDCLRIALRLINRPDSTVLHLQGLYFGELRDFSREEKAYREADQGSRSWGGSMFNLSLSFQHQKRYNEAIEAVDCALSKEPTSGAYMTHRGICLECLGQTEQAKKQFDKALQTFGHPQGASDWDLGWLITCAKKSGNDKILQLATTEQKQRREKSTEPPDDGTPRPIVRG